MTCRWQTSKITVVRIDGKSRRKSRFLNKRLAERNASLITIEYDFTHDPPNVTGQSCNIVHNSVLASAQAQVLVALPKQANWNSERHTHSTDHPASNGYQGRESDVRHRRPDLSL
jgi:hypothetical protein